MTTLMPRDGAGAAIPVLSLAPGRSHAIAVTATSARNSVAFNTTTRVISLYATVPMFVRMGEATVTAAATDHYLPADTLVQVAVFGAPAAAYSHVAAIRASMDGTLYVSELE